MDSQLANEISGLIREKHWTPGDAITQEFLRKDSNTDLHEQPHIQDYSQFTKPENLRDCI